MSKLNDIKFLDYLNDYDSDCEDQILETYSNGNISDLTYECDSNSSNSYDKCKINLNEINSSKDYCKNDLSKNPISSTDNNCQKDLSKNLIISSEYNCQNDLSKNDLSKNQISSSEYNCHYDLSKNDLSKNQISSSEYNCQNYLSKNPVINFQNDLSKNQISSSECNCQNDLSKNPNNICENDSIETEINDDYSLNDCMSFKSHISNKKVNYVNVKNNNIEIRQIYLQKKLEQLEILGNSFKKIGHSIEYYKYNLENSKDIILRETDEEASILLNDTSLNLYNIILLEVRKNINSSKLRFITFENVKLYEVPKIDLQFCDGIIKFSIIDNKKIYNFKIGCKYINSDDLEESIDDVVQESTFVYNYFNSRYNKISTIINYIKINSL